MNVVDIGILAVIAASLIFGLYRGFISSVANTGGALISFLTSFWLYPHIAGFVRNNTNLRQTLATYTDTLVRSADAQRAVGEISSQEMPGVIERVLSNLRLPQPIADTISNNLNGHLLGAEKTVQAYVSETLVNACINLLSFVVCFILLYVVFSLVMSALRAIFKLPVLKQFDTLAGGVFGLVRGVLLVFVVFALLPVAEALIPGDTVQSLVASSSLAGIFDSGALINSVLRGSLY